MFEAQSIIVSVFGAHVPITVKYNLFLLESYDKRPKGPERTQLLSTITDRNLDIVK